MLKVALVALLGAGNGPSRASACPRLTSISFPYEPLGTKPGWIFVSPSTAYEIGKNFTLEQHQRSQKEVAELCTASQVAPYIQKYVEEGERAGEERGGIQMIMTQNTVLSTTAYCAMIPERLLRYREAIYRSGDMIAPFQTEAELTETILTLHSLIVQGKETPSSYRTTLVSVYHYQLETWHLDRAKAPGFDDHKRVNIDTYIAPSANFLPELMLSFIQELKTGLRNMWYSFEFDTIGFAARVHQKLVNIHPFFDGNGRLARLLMNYILKIGGYPPVIFFSCDEYAEAIRIDQAETHGEDEQGVHFARFLRKVMQQNQEKRAVLNRLLFWPKSGQQEHQYDKEFQMAVNYEQFPFPR